MAPNYLEQTLAKLKEFEGCVPWMYRDTVGKVTVGIGLMLANAKAAQELPFRAAMRPATVQEIASDFARVDALPLGHVPEFYRSPASLVLPEQTIDARLSAMLQEFETELRNRLPRYDSFPDGVKMALLDMTYNLGPKGLFKEFPHFIAAVQSGAWAQAAEHCFRHGPSPARNAWTRQQFLAAVVTSIHAEAENWWTRIRRWIRLRLRGHVR
ncbi:MAG: hypothetical protein M3Y50_02040 [Acidobacteriota bacterium]|nr:hypothetical protein [Acidobacteriota bacterium]